MKICSVCEVAKPVVEFPAKGRRCRTCCSKATAEWYAKKAQNEDDRKAIQKQRNAWHQNKLRTDPRYREKHLARRRKRHADSSEITNPQDAARSAARLLTAVGRARSLLTNARQRDKQCDLTLADVLPTVEKGLCHRTGFKFDLSPHAQYHRNPQSPSIDRIDGSKGYVRGNIQIVCSWYNIAKNEYTDMQMLAFCRAVVDIAT